MRLAHDRVGRGTPLLLLHAGIADRRMWGPQTSSLSDRFDMVAADLPGFGGSPAPTEPISPRAGLAALLDDLSLDQVDLVGCSFGGSTALDFTIEYPSRVRRLVLIGAGISGMPLGEKDRALFGEVDAAEASGDIDSLNEAELVFGWMARGGPTATLANRPAAWFC